MFTASHEKYRIQIISWPISYTIPHCPGGQSILQHNTGIFKTKPADTHVYACGDCFVSLVMISANPTPYFFGLHVQM
jgi:hypothetical protein